MLMCKANEYIANGWKKALSRDKSRLLKHISNLPRAKGIHTNTRQMELVKASSRQQYKKRLIHVTSGFRGADKIQKVSDRSRRRHDKVFGSPQVRRRSDPIETIYSYLGELISEYTLPKVKRRLLTQDVARARSSL